MSTLAPRRIALAAARRRRATTGGGADFQFNWPAPGLYRVTPTDGRFTTVGYTHQKEMWFSPSGHKIAYAEMLAVPSGPFLRRASNIYIADPDGSNPQLVVAGSTSSGARTPYAQGQMGGAFIWVSDTILAVRSAVSNSGTAVVGTTDIQNSGRYDFYDVTTQTLVGSTGITGERHAESICYPHGKIALSFTGDIGLIDVDTDTNTYTETNVVWTPAGVRTLVNDWAVTNGITYTSAEQTLINNINYLDHAFFNPSGNAIMIRGKESAGGGGPHVTADFDGTSFRNWRIAGEQTTGHQHWFNDNLIFDQSGTIFRRDGTIVDANDTPTGADQMDSHNHISVHPALGKFAGTEGPNDEDLAVGDIGVESSSVVANGDDMVAALAHPCFHPDQQTAVCYFKHKPSASVETQIYMYVF